MLETTLEALKDLNMLLVLLGAAFAFLGVVGKVQTKWFALDLQSRIQRGVLVTLGSLFVLGAVLPALTQKNSAQQEAIRTRPYADRQSLRAAILEDGGVFAWQWAGENWIGRLTFKEENGEISGRLEVESVKKIHVHDPAKSRFNHAQVMRGGGRVVVHEDHIELKDFELLRREYGDGSQLAISAKLYPTIAFRGRIEYDYLNKREWSASGGMVIVKKGVDSGV